MGKSSNIVHQYFRKELDDSTILVKVNPILFRGTEITLLKTGEIEYVNSNLIRRYSTTWPQMDSRSQAPWNSICIIPVWPSLFFPACAVFAFHKLVGVIEVRNLHVFCIPEQFLPARIGFSIR